MIKSNNKGINKIINSEVMNTINTLDWMKSDYIFAVGTRDGIIRIFDARDSIKCVNEVNIFFSPIINKSFVLTPAKWIR